jgi:hypothetical protein
MAWNYSNSAIAPAIDRDTAGGWTRAYTGYNILATAEQQDMGHSH